MSEFEGEIGIQFTTHLMKDLTVPELVETAALAQEQGFSRVWVSDFIGERDVFTILTAIATQVSIGVGTAVIVPFLRNPLDLADTLATLSELTGEREISVGMGRGSQNLFGNRMEQPQPYRMLRETTHLLKTLLAGNQVVLGQYELLSSYFNFERDASTRLEVAPQSPVRFYLGGHGPTAMRTAGGTMDGLVVGAPLFPLLTTGRLERLVGTAEEEASESGAAGQMTNVAEVHLSMSENRDLARAFPKPFVAHMTTGSLRALLSDDEFRRLGIDPRDVERLRRAMADGTPLDEATAYVTDEMVDAAFIAGTPEECIQELEVAIHELSRLGFERISFAKLGPDFENALQLLSSELNLRRPA